MFVESMTYEEIAAEFLKDYQDVAARATNAFGRRPRMAKYINQHLGPDEYHKFDLQEYVSPRRNRWVVFFHTNGKRQFKQSGILKSIYMLYFRSDGMHAVTCDPYDPRKITFYPPHFFDRYRERCLKDTTLSHIEALEDYSLSSFASYATRLDSEKYRNSIFIVSKACVALGEAINDYLWECRTCLSYEDLKGEQPDIYQMLLPQIEKMKGAFSDFAKAMAGNAGHTVDNSDKLEFRIRFNPSMDGTDVTGWRKTTIRLSKFMYNLFVMNLIRLEGDLSMLPQSAPEFVACVEEQISQAYHGDAVGFHYDFGEIVEYAMRRQESTGSAMFM